MVKLTKKSTAIGVIVFIVILVFYNFYSFDDQEFCWLGKRVAIRSDIDHAYWKSVDEEKRNVSTIHKMCGLKADAGQKNMALLYENLCRDGRFSDENKSQADSIREIYFSNANNHLVQEKKLASYLSGTTEEVFRKFAANGNASPDSQSFIELCEFYAPKNGIQVIRPWVVSHDGGYRNSIFENCMSENKLVKEVPKVKVSYCKGIGW
ncbi:TPA: hypothetical protein ACKP1B_005481 [Serratia fonticola]